MKVTKILFFVNLVSLLFILLGIFINFFKFNGFVGISIGMFIVNVINLSSLLWVEKR